VCDYFKGITVRNLRVNFIVSPAKTYQRAASEVTVAKYRQSVLQAKIAIKLIEISVNLTEPLSN
jgi:hypothetical protein